MLWLPAGFADRCLLLTVVVASYVQVVLADPEAARMAMEVERVADDTGWQRKPGRQPISRGPMAFRLEGEGAEAKAALASGCGGVIRDGAVTLGMAAARRYIASLAEAWLSVRQETAC